MQKCKVYRKTAEITSWIDAVFAFMGGKCQVRHFAQDVVAHPSKNFTLLCISGSRVRI